MVSGSNLSVLKIFKRTLILFVAIILGWIESYSQSGNPFEIIPRNQALKEDQKTSRDSIENLIKQNPFEIIPSGKADTAPATIKKNIVDTFIEKALQGSSDENEVKSMLLWLMIFLFSVLALAVNINRKIVTKLYKAIFSLNLFNSLYRENKEENRLMFPLLYGLYFASLGVFLYQGLVHFKNYNNAILLIYLIGVIMLIYFIRHLSLKVFAHLYGLRKEVDQYLFNIVCYGSVMAIILIPLDFIIIFSRDEWSKNIFILGAIILILTYLLRQFKEIISSSNIWSRSIFHFLLYLCTFEITPLVLICIYIQRRGWV